MVISDEEWEQAERRIEERRRETQAEYERVDRERRERADKLKAEYLALPAIKRVEHWGSATQSWPIAESFQTLALALQEWAREQQTDMSRKV